MLSTRYVYLHEALGLGAMWLNQEAKLAGFEDESKLIKEVGEAATVTSRQTFVSKSVAPTGGLSAGQMAHQELLRRFVRQTDNIKQPETTSIALNEVELSNKCVIRKSLIEIMKQSFFHGSGLYGKPLFTLLIGKKGSLKKIA